MGDLSSKANHHAVVGEQPVRAFAAEGLKVRRGPVARVDTDSARVRFVRNPDLERTLHHVRFARRSGHLTERVGCLLRARSGRSHAKHGTSAELLVAAYDLVHDRVIGTMLAGILVSATAQGPEGPPIRAAGSIRRLDGNDCVLIPQLSMLCWLCCLGDLQ